MNARKEIVICRWTKEKSLLNLLYEKQQTLSILNSPEREKKDSFFLYIVRIFFSQNSIDAYRFGRIVVVVSFNQVSLSLSLSLVSYSNNSRRVIGFSLHSAQCALGEIFNISYIEGSNALLDFI
jgi:hypothetical protein